MNTDAQTSQLVGIVAANHTGYVDAMFNCMQAGKIAVPLRSTNDHDRIQAAGIKDIVIPNEGSAWMQTAFHPIEKETIALIAFTSGTEGAPKGVMLTQRNLAEVVTRLNSVMQLEDSIREYVGIPVYHSFGFGRCRAVATVGGQVFIPENGFNPSEIGTMLKNGEINAISAVPSLWRVLLANQDLIGSYGKRVRWIEIGSQYMSRQEKEAMKALFPEARIVQHYGLTEASRTTLLEIHKAEGESLESVGQALGTVEVRLTDEGQIAIRGDHVAQSYLIEGQEVPLRDEQGWFLTKDLGALEDGYLYYKGRADDVINCGGLKVHPEALETKIYASIGYGTGLAVCRKTDPIRGDGFLVAVTQEITIDKQQLQQVVLQATQELGVNAGNAITIVEVESLPKTATGKIQRRKLSEWYASQAPAEVQEPRIDTTAGDYTPVQAIFCRELHLRKVDLQDSFVSLGGDSLSYVQVAMGLERHLGFLPRGWEEQPIHELDQLVPKQHSYTTIETNILVRAIAICGIVLNRTHALPIIGGADLLLLAVGLNLARFQSNALFKGQFWQPATSLLRNLLIPYWFISLAYQVAKREFDWSVLFLVSNFSGVFVEFPFGVWFVDVLAQLIVPMCLLFSLRSVREFAKTFPWRFGFILLGLGIALPLLMPLVWNTDYLENRVPHMWLWLFAMGWCIHFAQSKVEKIVITVILAIITPIFQGGPLTTGTLWVLIGGNVLLWAPFSLAIPSFLSLPIQTIAAAAYYIYLTHRVFIHIVTNVLGISTPLVNAIPALIGGILIWSAVQNGQQFLTQHLYFGRQQPKQASQ